MVLPGGMRIRGHRCFDYLYKAGNRYHSSSIILRVVPARPSLLKPYKKNTSPNAYKFAVAISSKVSKKAVIRNKLRRLIHNHLRSKHYKSLEHPKKWALISLKPNSKDYNPNQILKECDQLLSKAGLV